MEEEKKTLKYQETMNVDAENIASKKMFGDQYTKLSKIHILKQQNYFRQNF